MKLSFFNFEPWQADLKKAAQELKEIGFVQRLLKKDFTLWKEKDEEISNRLGWLESPVLMQPLIADYQRMAEEIKKEGIKHLILLGMGGSTLAPEALNKILGPRPGYPDLLLLDSTSPTAVNRLARLITSSTYKSFFLVSSKSGTTTETLSFLSFFYSLTRERRGEQAGRYFMAITDPGTLLENLASALDFRLLLRGFPEVGGRFSALSPFGLFPAALMGLDLKRFLEPAVRSSELLKTEAPENPGIILGTIIGSMARAGQNKLTIILPPKLRSLSRWLEQLIAESTGKEGKGILPVIESLPLSLGSYGPDRLYVFYQIADEPDIFWQEKLEKLKRLKLPLIQILFSPEKLAEDFYLWELAVAVAGYFLKINPFNQPDVEMTKAKTRQLLQKMKTEEASPNLLDFKEENFFSALNSFLSDKYQKTEYLALLCFLPPDDHLEIALDNLARQLSEKTRVPTTWNYGPAYLHSTGQLYKGDAGRGKFIGLLFAEPELVPLPDLSSWAAPARSFNQLFVAQALADFAALQEKGRRCLAIQLKEKPVEGIFRLGELIRNLD